MEIQSAFDLIDLVLRNRPAIGRQVLNVDHPEDEFIYRGQPRFGLPLLPAVFRPEYAYKNCERNLFSEFAISNDAELRSYHDEFEQLCIMQHHGLPTRLLDWTKNPLIALFFSCINNPECDGELIAMSPSMLRYDFEALYELGKSAPVKIFSMLAKGDSPETIIDKVIAAGKSIDGTQIFIEFFTKGQHESLRIGACKPVIVQPAFIHPRLQVQRSVFTISGGLITDYPVTSPLDIRDIRHENSEIFSGFKVPAKSKKSILDQLRILGVDEATLFPDADHRANHLRLKHKRQGES